MSVISDLRLCFGNERKMTVTEKNALPNLRAAIVAVASRNAPLIGGTVALSVLYYALVPGDGNFLVPILIFSGLWLVLFGLNDRHDHRASERLVQPPSNGQWTAVCGTAQPLQDAPGDILACWFQVFDKVSMSKGGGGSGSERIQCRYDGYYLVPTGIRSAQGTVRLAGFPDLVHLDKVSLDTDMIARAKAAAYPVPSYLPKSVARELVLSKIRGSAETSLKYGTAPEAGRGSIKSWVLRPGDDVCVFGTWRDGELHPHRSRPRGLPVYSGNQDSVRERLVGDSRAFLWVGGVVLAAAACLAAWSFL